MEKRVNGAVMSPQLQKDRIDERHHPNSKGSSSQSSPFGSPKQQCSLNQTSKQAQIHMYMEKYCGYSGVTTQSSKVSVVTSDTAPNNNTNSIKAASGCSLFVPFDIVSQDLEEEELFLSEEDLIISRVTDKRTRQRFTQLARTVRNEIEYEQLLKSILHYQFITHDGLLSILKWSNQMFLDKAKRRIHKFLIVFDVVWERLDERFPNSHNPTLATIFSQEDLKVYVNLIQAIQRVYEDKKAGSHFDIMPILPTFLTFSTDNAIKFVPQSFLSTHQMITRSQKYIELFTPPECFQSSSSAHESAITQTFHKLTSSQLTQQTHGTSHHQSQQQHSNPVKKQQQQQIQNQCERISEKERIFQIGMNLLLLLTNNIPENANRDPAVMRKVLAEVEVRQSAALKEIIEGMVRFDPADRFDCKKTIEKMKSIYRCKGEVVLVGEEKYSYSDDYDFFQQTGFVQMPKQSHKFIASIFPFTKKMVQWNLFEENKVYTSQLELEIDYMLPSDAVVLSTDNRDVWVIGGKLSDSINLLDDEVPTLREKAKIPCESQRFGFGACYLGESIYLVGGVVEVGNEPTNRVQRYDITKDTWEELEGCEYPVNGCTVVVLNAKRLLKFGGRTATGVPVTAVELYEIASNSWKTIHCRVNESLPSIPTFYKAQALQINAAQVLIIGGYLIDAAKGNKWEQNLNWFFLDFDERALNLNVQEYMFFASVSKADKVQLSVADSSKSKKSSSGTSAHDQVNKNHVNTQQDQQQKAITTDSITLALENVWIVQTLNKVSKSVFSYNHKTNLQFKKKIHV